jgi:hypothetical protein
VPVVGTPGRVGSAAAAAAIAALRRSARAARRAARRAWLAVAHLAWIVASLPRWLSFRRAMDSVEGSQRTALARILRRNSGSAYARRHGFVEAMDPDQYRARAPLVRYGDLGREIAAIAAGEAGVLTMEPVDVLEPTGGSTASSKLIPCTMGLREEIQRAVAPWIVDLYVHRPWLLTGSSYWSITPAGAASPGKRERSERSPEPAAEAAPTAEAAPPAGAASPGVPIGFLDDAEYFSVVERFLVRSIQCVPPAVARIADVPSFQYATLRFLVADRDLALVSVWSPTFLAVLLACLRIHAADLVRDVRCGTLGLPASLGPGILDALSSSLVADPERADELAAVFERWWGSVPPPCRGSPFQEVWPRLSLISCWTDGASGTYAAELARMFPAAEIQGKGLLATEGVVSIPLTGADGCALAVRSHFLEFLPLGAPEGSATRCAWELVRGERHRVILTTGGGLYRYLLDDVVEVIGGLGGCPLVRFVGRHGNVSDRCGEKLDELHVAGALVRILARAGVAADVTFAMVAPEEGAPPRYVLFLELESGGREPDLARLALDLDTELAANPQYAYCRRLGQLGAAGVFRIRSPDRAGGALARYQAALTSAGQRLGVVKPAALSSRTGWSRELPGELVA